MLLGSPNVSHQYHTDALDGRLAAPVSHGIWDRSQSPHQTRHDECLPPEPSKPDMPSSGSSTSSLMPCTICCCQGKSTRNPPWPAVGWYITDAVGCVSARDSPRQRCQSACKAAGSVSCIGLVSPTLFLLSALSVADTAHQCAHAPTFQHMPLRHGSS